MAVAEARAPISLTWRRAVTPTATKPKWRPPGISVADDRPKLAPSCGAGPPLQPTRPTSLARSSPRAAQPPARVSHFAALPPHTTRVCKGGATNAAAVETTCDYKHCAGAFCADADAKPASLPVGESEPLPTRDDELLQARAQLAEARAQVGKLLQYLPRCFHATGGSALGVGEA